MQRGAFHTLVTFACLLAWLATTLVPARGAVLCIERGGGVAIEPVAQGGSCSGCDEQARDEPSGSYGAPACECVDVTLPSIGDSVPRPSVDRFAAPPVALTPQFVLALPPPEDRARSQAAAAALRPLPVHRGTILRL